MAASTRLIASLMFLLAVSGCPGDDDPTAEDGGSSEEDGGPSEDDGGPSEEDGGVDLGEFVYTNCGSRPPADAACAFSTPCTSVSDFYMGYCGNETWECRAGRVVYSDSRYACMLPYGGVDAGDTMDAGPDAGLPDAAVEAGPLSDRGADGAAAID